MVFKTHVNIIIMTYTSYSNTNNGNKNDQ